MLHEFFQRLLRLMYLRHVAGNLGEAEQRPGIAADGIDHYMREKPAAILAHPPALVFETPFPRCGLQRPLRLAVLTVLSGVENRKMLADDLFRPIALDRCAPDSSSTPDRQG